ncbi:WYL domain-containing protein [Streptomyces sp. NPDC007100]|uniref:WYL domain-containing protein n=1 Tax=Streptomyces sp. NPDC007100 TaxID=3155602 RepID=UPI00340B3A28
MLVDSTAWFAAPEAAVEVSDLASTLRHRRRLRVLYRRSAESQASTRVVDPYGLVAKSGRWYLVADDQGDSRLLALERLSAFEQLDAPAVLQPGENLRTRWAVLKRRTEEQDRVSVTIRLPEKGLDLARRILGTRIHHVSDAEKGSCVVVRYPDIESVRQLLQFGDHIEVLAPETARARISQLARTWPTGTQPPHRDCRSGPLFSINVPGQYS